MSLKSVLCSKVYTSGAITVVHEAFPQGGSRASTGTCLEYTLRIHSIYNATYLNNTRGKITP